MKNILAKTKMWRGITVAISVLCALVIGVTVMAFNNPNVVNNLFGLAPPSLPFTGDTMVYKTEFAEDGVPSDASYAKMIEEVDKFNKREMQEGAVLIKNEADALPLASTERSVTFFGRAAVNPVYRNTSAGPAWNDRRIPLNTAFTNAGFSVNTTAWNALSARTEKWDNATGAIGEVPSNQVTSFYGGSANGFTDTNFTTAIVVLTRAAGEGLDAKVNSVSEAGKTQLSLHTMERDMLMWIKNNGNFNKTIVLINSAYAMELAWLYDADLGINAALWIGGPGSTGFSGVPGLLTGEANPSGHFISTYATNQLSAPAMMNFGAFNWANLSAVNLGAGQARNPGEYVVQAEGIYTGYKYYETRYEDYILNRHGADSDVGTYASSGNWRYHEEMAFPFGYGMSYTTFTQEIIGDIAYDADKDEFTVKVNVTNTGNLPGKSVVQVYAQVPYSQYAKDNGVEKSAIQLVGFNKTGLLAKSGDSGDSQEIEVKVDRYFLASYSSKAVNGEGAYVLDPGNYYLAIGDNVHDALNNILAKKVSHESLTGTKPLTDIWGSTVSGNAGKAQVVLNLAALDDTSYATSSETGERVKNKFDDIDANYWTANSVTYLTRSDWSGTYPKTYTGANALTATSAMIEKLKGEYKKPTNAPSAKTITQEAENNLKFFHMIDVPYDDDEKWNKFIDQLSIVEMCNLLDEYWQSPAIERLGKPASINGDGPDGTQHNSKYGDKASATTFVNQSVAAATWSPEVLKRRGQLQAEEALHSHHNAIWSPGGNLHRTPFSGRNFEYYSECGNFGYIAGGIQARAMQDRGLMAGIKHLAANDQESGRTGISTFMNEQTFREGAMRGFEGALRESVGGSLYVMTSYNRVGAEQAAHHYQMITGVLRNEWGFKGVVVTDAMKEYMQPINILLAGSDQYCMAKQNSREVLLQIQVRDDGHVLNALRQATKNHFYAYARSSLINGLSADTVISDWTPWWMPTLIVVTVLVGLLVLTGATFFVLGAYVLKKRGDQ